MSSTPPLGVAGCSKHCYCAPAAGVHQPGEKIGTLWSSNMASPKIQLVSSMSLAINSILNEDVPPRLPEATCNQDAQQKQFKRPHLGTPNLGFDD
jgi:hypothetical protein